MKRPGPELLLLGVLACGGERPDTQPATFAREEPGRPVPVAVLHSARDTVQGGRIAGVDVHVLFPVAIDRPTARATLQHVIDSVAAGDSLVAGIRVIGFMVGAYDPATGEAAVEPMIVGVWAPADTAGFTGRTAFTMFRTTFTVLRPLPGGSGPGGGGGP